MNIPNILKLADYIESEAQAYTQGDWGYCVFGQYYAMEHKRLLSYQGTYNLTSALGAFANFLGLPFEVVFPYITSAAHGDVYPTRENAVNMLRNLALTGKVEWYVAPEVEKLQFLKAVLRKETDIPKKINLLDRMAEAFF